MAVCAVTAYVFAERVLGHANPVFAAIAALLTLQFSSDWRTRRALDVAVGCALGVAAGVFFTGVFGSGPAQAVLIVFVAVLIARFLNKSAVFATQMAIQAALVAMIPSSPGSFLPTVTDALVGGAAAWVMTIVAPQRGLRRQRKATRKLAYEISAVLYGASRALDLNDSSLAWHALIRARHGEAVVAEANEALGRALETATISPLYWRHRESLRASQAAVEKLDLALRNSRVFSRRLIHAINAVALSDRGTLRLSAFLKRAARAVTVLADGLWERDRQLREEKVSQALDRLVDLGVELDPARFGAETLDAQALVMTFRPLMIDLMQAAGASHAEALSSLPSLGGLQGDSSPEAVSAPAVES
ncbi:FUSC family protein [Arthrobacter sp. SW1]|uniref:FUSC family protein n=1 Tax=Arthrobacter sp. SW1 TaxID=1920889 RepID=UPI0025B77B68|nr:FUSC family protein [Arthrobacter sp. SW1]